MGWGEHCKENPELSPKAVTAGIHYPSGDVFMASVSHCQAFGWEQPIAWAANNLDGVQAAHPAPHNGNSQAALPPEPTHSSPGPCSRLSAVLSQIKARVFSRMLHFSLEKQCQSTAPPCHITSHGSAPLCPCPWVRPALSRGYHFVMIRNGAAGSGHHSAEHPNVLHARTSAQGGNEGKNTCFDLLLHLESYF